MDRTTLWLGRLGAGALVGVLGAVLVIGVGGPATAFEACPPQFDLCQPAGLLLLADPVFAAEGATAVAAATGVGSTALTATSGGLVNFALSITGALAVGAVMLNTSDPDLGGGGGDPATAGWVNGNNHGSFYSGYTGQTSTYSLSIQTSVQRGGSGSVTVVLTSASGCPQSIEAPILASGGGTQWRTTAFNWTEYLNCVPGMSAVTKGVTNLTGIVAAGAQWYPVGTPGRYEPPAPTRDGVVTATVMCVNASGATVAVTKEIPVVGGAAPSEVDIPSAECPAGSVAQSSSVDWHPGNGGSPVHLGGVTNPEWVRTIPTEFPGCVDGGCSVELWKVFSGAPALFCGVAAVGCPEWWTDPGKESHFECRYGGEIVGLGQCSVYRKPGVVSPNAPAVTDPVTGAVTIGAPVVTVDPADFTDVTWNPQPNPNPNPDPNPDPDPDPNPNPPLPDPDPRFDNPDTSKCWPSGWGVFNPVEWVYRPIVCGLTWAFVPPAGSLERLSEDFQDGVGGKPPFSIIGPASSAIGQFVGSHGNGTCGFGNFFPTLPGDHEVPCTRPGTWDPVYVVETLLIWTLALWTAVRMVAASVGNKEAGT